MEGAVLSCPSCGQANRVPPVGSGQKAICGKCRGELGAESGGIPLTLTDANFAQLSGSGRMVIDFWAGWCGPCVMIAPIINELARERTDVRFGKLNVDENPRTSAAFQVQGIPLLVFMNDGKEAGRVTGAVPKSHIEAAIARFLRT